MGSQKYPDENKFDKFMMDNGGEFNGITLGENTTFKFAIQRSKFFTALDIFAQFFIHPLIKKEAMNREREAVDNEFVMRFLPMDFKRCGRVHLTNIAKPNHPVGRTYGSCGNKQTLSVVRSTTLQQLTSSLSISSFWTCLVGS